MTPCWALCAGLSNADQWERLGLVDPLPDIDSLLAATADRFG